MDLQSFAKYREYAIVSLCILLYGCGIILRHSFQPLTEVFRAKPFEMSSAEITKAVTAYYSSYSLLQIPTGIMLQFVSAELSLIIPVFLSGLCAQLVHFCNTYSHLFVVRIALGLTQATCFLSIMTIIQQYFSLHHFAFYSGIALMVGNAAPIITIYQKSLLKTDGIWREPHVALGTAIQCLCIILFILFIIDRKTLIRSLDTHKMDELEQVTNQWCVARSQLTDTIAHETDTNHTTIAIKPESSSSQDSDVHTSFKQKAFAVLSNRYTYLFAFVYCCQCIPQSVLGALWLKDFLCVKFKDTAVDMCEERAQQSAVLTFIGAGLASLLFGYIAKRYHQSNHYINRQLMLLGFALNSVIAIVVYVPSHYFYSRWLLYMCIILHGGAVGTVCVVFTGLRQVHDKNKSADLASGFVASLALAGMSLFGMLFASVLNYVDDKSGAKDGHGHDQVRVMDEDQYNEAFLAIVAVIAMGCTASFFIPKN
eukprot:253298_1